MLFILLFTFLQAQETTPPPQLKEAEAKPEVKNEENEAKLENNHTGEYFAEKPFFKFAPLVITIFKNNQPVSLVNIESSIETLDSEWEKIRLKVPLLYNNLFIDLYQSLNTLWDQVTPLSPATIEKRFQFVCDELLGKGNVKKVTINLILIVPRKE